MICFFVWFCGKWTYALEVLQCSVHVLKKWRKNRARCLWKGRGTELLFTISTGLTRSCLVFFWSFFIFLCVIISWIFRLPYIYYIFQSVLFTFSSPIRLPSSLVLHTVIITFFRFFSLWLERPEYYPLLGRCNINWNQN